MRLVKKLLLQIIDNQKDIKKRLSPENAIKAQKYDLIIKNLKNIKFHVKKADIAINENGLFDVVVHYEPVIKILQDSNGLGVEGDDMFKAMNKLDLIDSTDFKKISEAIEIANSKNKKLK